MLISSFPRFRDLLATAGLVLVCLKRVPRLSMCH